MLPPNCGIKTQLLVEYVLNACKLSISGVDQPANATLILRFSSSDLTLSTRSLANQSNASTLLLAMPLPGMTALTIATIAQTLHNFQRLNTATNVHSELESVQDAKPTSFLTEQ